ncbi:MAG: glycosyltransferase, partial [Bacillota bacterium]
ILKVTKLTEVCLIWNEQEQLKDVKQELKKITEFDKTINMPKKITYLLRDGLDKAKSLDCDAFVFDTPDSEDAIIYELEFFKPQHIVGTLNSDDVSSFSVWEKAREYAESMYLFGWGIDKPSEILAWTKRDIELSVILPMYNIAKYLPKCIETVTAWKAPYIEFLFVDDGSPDNCAEIVQEYAKNDNRIKLLTKENGGCASARQYGMDRAQGTYIGFIDPDDYIDPTMYKKLLSRAMQGSYEISHCGFNFLYENTGEIVQVEDNIGYPYCNGVTDAAKVRELMASLRVAIWRGIYLRSRIEQSKISFYTDLPRFDDLPFKVEIYSSARSVVSISEYLYYYRLAREGQDVAADDQRLYVHFDIFKHLDTHMSSRKKFTDQTRGLIQLCKVHTHKYALTKIRKEFFNEYCIKAKADMFNVISYKDTVAEIKKLGSKNDIAFVHAIEKGKFGAVKKLASK